jgi:hypothetical protein|tara:strand:- start:111 stop:833 length:723 start_codon:yes stop_codon:yes gene_type:complete
MLGKKSICSGVHEVLMRITCTVGVVLLCVITPTKSYSHGGGLDSNGGHFNRKAGEYHCHREPCFSIHQQSDKATQEAEREGYSFTTLYSRDDWNHWIDADGDCQDTRAEILIRDSQQPVQFKSNRQCRVTGGLWALPYTGGTVTNASQIDIDHIIPLKWAHGHGGDRWTPRQKQAFANDSDNLLATYFAANRSKGTKGPDDWMPAVDRCEYANRWEQLLTKYELPLYGSEQAGLIGACRK